MPYSIWRRGKDPVWDELLKLRGEFDNLFDVFSPSTRQPLGDLWRDSRLFPLMNVSEDAESFLVKAEIPGMEIADLDIKIEGDTLSVKGERKPEKFAGEVSYHRRERACGAFQRSITLPKPVDSEGVNATYRNGVLYITLPKARAIQPKQITVETS
ncbi:Hsp20/alpha crystallin family protein [Thermodesulfobacteriota bacterium]